MGAFTQTKKVDFTGTGPHEVALQPGKSFTQLTFFGQNAGSVTIKMKGWGGDTFEDMTDEYGNATTSVDLTTAKRTVVISGVFAEAVQLLHSTNADFSVSVVEQ